MNSPTDQQLLREYSGGRSETAFAELVRRQVDLVYSAALRMVRDSHLAKDVTQGVFVALAQNAGPLAERPVLAGWLHRTTQNLAANAIRSDVRRRVREQEAATMNELLSTPEASWEPIAQQLDAALGSLSEPDRDALLLRYFEHKSAQEMAPILGLSAEAAQKRVNRAVDRLRDYFSKHNVTIGASGLVVLLTANAVQSAPVGLAATISAASGFAATAATTTVVLTTKTITMTLLQKNLILAALAVATGAGVYAAHQTSQLQQQNQALVQQQTALTAQLQALQRARDEATNELTALAEENQHLKSGQKQNEMLQLRNQVGVLRQTLSSVNTSNQPQTGIAKMLGDPAMKEYVHQAQLKAVRERYGALFRELKLSGDDAEKFTSLIGEEWMKGTELGAKATRAGANPVEMQAAVAQEKTEVADLNQQLQALLGDAGYARYQEYGKQVPAQMVVSRLNTQLVDNALSDDQSQRLFNIIAAEPFTATHGMAGDLDDSFLRTQADIDQHMQQVNESNQHILDQAANVLNPPQLTALSTFLSNSVTAQINQGAALVQKH